MGGIKKMKALTNKINVNFNFNRIDSFFDIFQITTSERFIKDGAYQLYKPVVKLKALSVLFEPKSRSAFVLYKKNEINSFALQESLETDSFTVTLIPSS